MTTPLFMRYSKLTVTTQGGTSETFDFECDATSIGLTSTGGDLSSITTLCPAGSFSEVNPRTWGLAVTAVQDVESIDSFMLFLMDHEGELADAVWYPKTDAQKNPIGRGWQGTVTISVPDTVGGVEPGNYATFSTTLPYQGKPLPIDSAGNPTGPGVISGVTPGAPATFEPASAVAPATIADLKADPVIGDAAYTSAAWDVPGDYAELRDASHAYWDGTEWLVGEVPTP